MQKQRQQILQGIMCAPGLYIVYNQIFKHYYNNNNTIILQNVAHIVSGLIGLKLFITIIWNILAQDLQNQLYRILSDNFANKVLLIFYSGILILLSQQQSFKTSVTSIEKVYFDWIYTIFVLKVNKNNMAQYREKIMQNGFGLQKNYRKLVFESAVNLILYFSYLVVSLRIQNYLFMTMVFNLLLYSFIQQQEQAVQMYNKIWLFLWLSPFIMLVGYFFIEQNSGKQTDLVFHIQYLAGVICLFLLKLFAFKSIQTWNIVKTLSENKKIKDQIQYERHLKVLEFQKNYKKQISKMNQKQDCQCSICSLQMKENKIKLNCNHTFHYDCLIVWLKLNFSCPICRKKDIL